MGMRVLLFVRYANCLAKSLRAFCVLTETRDNLKNESVLILLNGKLTWPDSIK